MNDRWARMVSALIAFRRKHGHCRVPTNGPEYGDLGRWVAAVRYKRRLGVLPDACIRELDKLGFVWFPRETEWEEMFAELLAFRKKYGHCLVPETWPKNPKLARWVQSQRQRKRMGKLSRDRMARLEAAGFIWHVHKLPVRKEMVPAKASRRSKPCKVKPVVEEKLYWLGNDTYIQYNGRGPQPAALRKYVAEHQGELPPFIPLPGGKTTFFLGNAFVSSKKVVWKGRGPLPKEVVSFVRQNGALPRYECCGISVTPQTVR
ncbi:MAG: helicase associated domain-containing protein [Kiritimatiellae bacterium]|nr:helicase associated domain-containing protein [Kiritimatiellia bacterium]